MSLESIIIMFMMLLVVFIHIKSQCNTYYNFTDIVKLILTLLCFLGNTPLSISIVILITLINIKTLDDRTRILKEIEGDLSKDRHKFLHKILSDNNMSSNMYLVLEKEARLKNFEITSSMFIFASLFIGILFSPIVSMFLILFTYIFNCILKTVLKASLNQPHINDHLLNHLELELRIGKDKRFKRIIKKNKNRSITDFNIGQSEL